MTVGCTKCLAPRGSYCRSTPRRAGGNGYQNSAVGFHKARQDAVAHLGEQQRYDAYAEMRAEEAALREQVSRRLAQPLSPEQQRVRKATGEAWRRAGAEATAELRAVQERRKPLSPIRGVAPVADLAAERARRRGVSVGGDVA
jgi:hypothetical protein